MPITTYSVQIFDLVLKYWQISEVGVVSSFGSTCLSVINCEHTDSPQSSNPIMQLLHNFSSLSKSFNNELPASHKVKQNLETTGLPVAYISFRLGSVKRKIAKAAFKHRQRLDIIRPFNNPWAIPLHISNVWCISLKNLCVSYWKSFHNRFKTYCRRNVSYLRLAKMRITFPIYV